MPNDDALPNTPVPDRAQVLETVTEIVADKLDVPVNRVQQGDELKTTLGCDSLDLVEITMSVEEAFDICFPDDQVDGDLTVGRIVDGVLQLLHRQVERA